jgi:DnaJ-class molecular chaperone
MDYYEILGVTKTASQEDIKGAWRRLASQHHPDKGGDKVKFQETQAAYETLSDANKRQQYDNPMPQGFPQQGGIPPGFEHIFGQMFGGNNPFDIFSQQRRQQQPQQQLFRTTINISLEQAYNGGEQILKLQTPTNVHAITIQIPKGIQNDNQMRIDKVIDGASLIVDFRVEPHLKYDRQGNDLICNHPISVLDLIIGTSFEFVTLSGKTLDVTIKPKTQPYIQLKLAGQGMPILNATSYGDQIILLKAFIPDIIGEQVINSITAYKQQRNQA